MTETSDDRNDRDVLLELIILIVSPLINVFATALSRDANVRIHDCADDFANAHAYTGLRRTILGFLLVLACSGSLDGNRCLSKPFDRKFECTNHRDIALLRIVSQCHAKSS
jgi:hypothetical protein